MKRVSSRLIVLGLAAALGSVTTGSLQAAETPYQGIQNARGSVQIAANQDPGSRGPALNVALATNGAVAAASSTGFSDDGPPASASKLIDDTRSGANSYWTDDTVDEFPDEVQVNFFGNKTIDRVVVYSVQDNYFDGVDPTDTDPCYVYGLVDFTVEGWNGRDWVTLANVTDNLLCKRTVTFLPFTTDQIRINVTITGGWSWTRIAEVEAWEAQ